MAATPAIFFWGENPKAIAFKATTEWRGLVVLPRAGGFNFLKRRYKPTVRMAFRPVRRCEDPNPGSFLFHQELCEPNSAQFSTSSRGHWYFQLEDVPVKIVE